MKTTKLTFTAGETKVLQGGNFLTLMSTSDPVDIQLRKDGSPGELAVQVEEGFYTQPERTGQGQAFTSVEITSATAQTIKVGISDGRGGTNEFAGQVDALLTSPNTITSAADQSVTAGAAAIIAAQNSNRREAIISNPVTNSAAFRVGDASVTASRGIPLEPGEKLVLSTSAEVRAFNTHTAAQSVSVVEISDV